MPKFLWKVSNLSVALRLKHLHYGLDTPKEFLLYCLDWLSIKLGGSNPCYHKKARIKRLAKTFREGNIYRIRDVKLPALNEVEEDVLFNAVFDDTFTSYVMFNDDYSEKTFDLCDELLSEGLYGLVNDKVNVTVEPGDIVIDAGSWIGDFAAYASVRGAHSYAFEPTDTTFKLLKRTAELNGNITPINQGLSDEKNTRTVFVSTEGNSGANTFRDTLTNTTRPSTSVATTTIDDFVRENNLARVDFIKADIEGFERHMLAGAQETLARFAPKLALCTYHLPDDPQVMAELILKANPRYNIVQKHHKLYASVPE